MNEHTFAIGDHVYVDSFGDKSRFHGQGVICVVDDPKPGLYDDLPEGKSEFNVVLKQGTLLKNVHVKRLTLLPIPNRWSVARGGIKLRVNDRVKFQGPPGTYFGTVLRLCGCRDCCYGHSIPYRKRQTVSIRILTESHESDEMETDIRYLTPFPSAILMEKAKNG